MEPKGIVERSDVDVRRKEGLEEVTGLLWGEAPPNPLTITEHGVRYPVDVFNGHKTGFYLDQRDSRRWLLTDPAVQGAEVLNAFGYTGSFGVCAALNGAARVVNVDSSQAALDAGAEIVNDVAAFTFDPELAALPTDRLIEIGQEIIAIVLEADGKHLFTDVWTSAGVVLAVGLSIALLNNVLGGH